METIESFQKVITECEQILLEKSKKYGTSWTAYRTGSLVDKLWIKAKRIRTVQETGKNQVNESVHGEFQALINYSILCILQIRNNFSIETNLDSDHLAKMYRGVVSEAGDLLIRKNHDYGEAWRDMSVKTITDEILVKLLRCRSMVQFGDFLSLDQELFDIMNYSVFALILLGDSVLEP